MKKNPGRKKSRGQRNIEWIEKYCVVPEGKEIGKPIKLRGWQKTELLKIYDNPNGTRMAILSFGRKNGKTALISFLLLLHLCGPEAVTNGQLYSAAQSREQAGIVFRYAMKCVRLSPLLGPFVQIKESSKELHCADLGTSYRALSAEASTAYGLSPAFIVHDELGQVQGPRSDLYEALETACAAHDNPLSVVISTQSPNDGDLLSILIDDAVASNDPKVVVSLWAADKLLDPFSEEAIKAANPAFGDFQNADEVRKQAEDARRMPARETSYRNLILNQRVALTNPFVSLSVWQGCKTDEDFDLEDVPVFGGLDLSTTTDLTALTLIGKVNDKWHIKPTFWLPAHNLEDKARIDRVPYDVWNRQGYLETVPGKTVDYEWVAYQLLETFHKYNVKAIGFDRWNFKSLRSWLVKVGFTDSMLDRFVEFGQGYASMSPALMTLETKLLNQQIVHGNHPVLNMCAANAIVENDAAGNRKLTKAKSHGRIDGMVALTMAVSVATLHEEIHKESVYEKLAANKNNTSQNSVYEELKVAKEINWEALQDRNHPEFAEAAAAFEKSRKPWDDEY